MLANWQVRGILRVSQELNARAVPGEQGTATASEVIVRFYRSECGAITLQVLGGVEEILREEQPPTLDTAVNAE